MPVNARQECLAHRARSVTTHLTISIKMLARRLVGKPLMREWPIAFEIGTLFWRAQFKWAFAREDIAEGRAYFDSLITGTKMRADVDIQPAKDGEPRGDWCNSAGGHPGLDSNSLDNLECE